jgi:Golgi phosphoprotein 3 (GPP34)
MDALGEDLVLLSIRPDKGQLTTISRIDFGLMGSELVRLAASRRIDIRDDRVIVLSQIPTGDPELDTALASLAQPGRPPRPKVWVGRRRRGIRDDYLRRLVASGALRAQPGRFFGTRYFIADPARVADARARLDAIALSTGQVDTAQAAFGGLAHAIGLDLRLYRGRTRRQAYKRMAEIGKGQWTVAAVTGAVADATRSATQAATDAATRAAMQSATDAAIQAAVHAATSAAVESGHHAGGGVAGGAHGGHH